LLGSNDLDKVLVSMDYSH